ncbi:MAG: hypothetical protein JW895_07630 [Thermoleophilaceae bacterium]|nr:hypothetical protein [Thermoleophilaceae bacterium]
MKSFRKPSLPSPAMVVALVALFVALGGSAYALTITGASIRNGTITGADVKNRSLKGTKFALNSIGGNAIKASALKSGSLTGRLLKDDTVTGTKVDESTLGTVPQATGAQLQAVVNAQGQLVAGRGVASNGVAHTVGTGVYQVTFDRSVAACAYSGMLVDSAGGTPPVGLIGAATIAANPNAVQVGTADADGTAADRPFHIVLSC